MATNWNDLANQQLVGTRYVTHAAIVGQDGTIWGKSTNMNITIEEGKAIFAIFTNDSYPEGIVAGGIKYLFRSKTESSIMGTKGYNGGIHIAKTNSAMVIGIYENLNNPTICGEVVDKFAMYMSSGLGY